MYEHVGLKTLQNAGNVILNLKFIGSVKFVYY